MIQAIGTPKQINFGYKNILKTQWLKGNMPQVKKGFYGGILTKDNVTLEHLKPHSKGGKTELSNLVLAKDINNWSRGSSNLKKVLNPEAMENYLKQFEDIKLPDFDGKNYIKMITKTVTRLIKE